MNVYVAEISGSYQLVELDDFKVWIYSDGNADFASSYLDRRFEKYDFGTPDLLIEKLIGELREGILNKKYYIQNPQISPAPILNRIVDSLAKLFRFK